MKEEPVVKIDGDLRIEHYHRYTVITNVKTGKKEKYRDPAR